jgi:hypothetical protein
LKPPRVTSLDLHADQVRSSATGLVLLRRRATATAFSLNPAACVVYADQKGRSRDQVPRSGSHTVAGSSRVNCAGMHKSKAQAKAASFRSVDSPNVITFTKQFEAHHATPFSCLQLAGQCSKQWTTCRWLAVLHWQVLQGRGTSSIHRCRCRTSRPNFQCEQPIWHAHGQPCRRVTYSYYSPAAGVQEATSSGYYTDAFILARIRQPLLLPGCPNLCSDLPLLASACRPEARVVVVVARTNSINNSALAAPPASRPSWLLPAGDLVSSIRLLSWSPGACVRACPSLGLEPPKGFLEQIDEFQCQGLTCTDTHG